MSRGIELFATRDDLLVLLAEVEARRAIYYADAGMFESPEIVVYRSAAEIPDLGVCHVHSRHLGHLLLIADVGTQFIAEPVPQRRGGVLHVVGQRKNHDTVVLYPGGIHDSQTVIAGTIATGSDSAASLSLFEAIRRAVRKQWVHIEAFYVGKEAESIMDAGGRLTQDLRAPRGCDLKR